MLFKSVSTKLGVERIGYLKILFILLLLIINPITLQIKSTHPFTFRDTDTYIAFAMNLFNDGRLYLPSWGHVDAGLILPPLYPFLVSLGNIFMDDPVRVARWISSACMIFSLVPIYFYLISTSNILTAIATVTLIAINSEYVFYGLASLTEPLFLFLLCSALYLARKIIDEGNEKLPIFFLGILTALVFMARQVGIVLFIFIIVWMLLRAFANKEIASRVVAKKIFLFVLGWLVIFSPYAVVLYHQTGQTPFKQSFRTFNYSVETTDPEVISKIQRIRGTPEYGYDAMYIKRRYLHELLPDSSEMLAYVAISGKHDNNRADETANPVTMLVNATLDPARYLKKIYNNLSYLEDTVGVFFLAIFILSCITPLVIRYHGIDNLSRMFLPLFMVTYLMVISMVGDYVARYMQIIYPLGFTQAGVETYLAYKMLLSNTRLKDAMPIIIPALLIWSVFVTPKYFFDVRTVTERQSQKTDLFQLSNFRKYVKEGDPIFSLFANQALYSGGTFRIMPNDSLEKVVKYGKRTGVRWILVSKAYGSINESYYNIHAKWYRDPLLITKFPHLLRYCCSVDDTYHLYEIR